MSNMKKSILVFMSVIIFVTSSVLSVYAMEKDTVNGFYVQDDYIVDSAGHKYWGFTNSLGEAVPVEQALEIFVSEANYQRSLMNSYSERGVVPALGPVTLSSVNSKYVGSAVRVTPEVLGPMDVSHTVSTTSSTSVTGNLTVAAKNLIFQVVDAEVSVSITSSSARTESVTVSGTVSSGKTGAIYFKPYYVRATGTYSDDGGVTVSSFTACYPRLLSNGLADGLFYLYEY